MVQAQNSITSLSITGGSSATAACGGSTITIVPSIQTTNPTTVTAVTYSASVNNVPIGGSFNGSGAGFNGSFTIPAVPTASTLVVQAVGYFSDGSNTSSSPTSLTIAVFPAIATPVTATVTPGAICAGASSTITVPSGLTIASASGPGFLALPGTPTTVLNVTTSAAASGIQTYSLVVSNASGCTAATTASLTVNPIPTATLVASSSINCTNRSATITATPTFAGSYTYTFAQAGFPTLTTNTSGTYTIGPAGDNVVTTAVVNVTLTSAGGCSGTATLSVPVDTSLPASGPSLTIVSTGNFSSTTASAVASSTTITGTVCQGTSLVLSVSGCVTAPPATTGTVNNDPVVLVSGPNGTTITGASTTTTVPGGPAVTVFTIPTNITTAAGSPFLYTIACKNSNGCSSTQVVGLALTVNPTPTESATVASSAGTGPLYTVCATNTYSLSVSCPTGFTTLAKGTGFGLSPATYSVLTNPYLANGAATTAQAGSYSVACQNSSGCIGPVTTYTIVVNPAPAPVSLTVNSTGNTVTSTVVSATSLASSAGSISVCSGSSLSIVTNCLISSVTSPTTGQNNPPLLGGTTGLTAIDNGGVGVGNGDGGSTTPGSTTLGYATFTTANALTATTTQTFVYTFTCSNTQFGCSSPYATTLSVTVNPVPAKPTLGGFAGGLSDSSTTLCQSNTVRQFAFTCPTGGSTLYATNSGSGTGLTGTGAYTIAAGGSGVYSFTGLCGTASCTSVATTYSFTIVSAPNTPALTVTGGSSTTTAVAGNGVSVSVCAGKVLTVKTDCVISTINSSSGNGGAPVFGGVNTGTGNIDNGSSGTGTTGGSSTTSNPGSTTVASFTALFPASAVATSPYVYTFNCTNTSGCPSLSVTSLTVTVNPTPGDVNVVGISNTTVCQSSSPINITATCSSASAIVTGSGIGFTTGTVGTTTISTIPANATGVYGYSVVCTNSSGCSSTPKVYSLTIIAAPNAPALTVTGGATTPVTAAATSGTAVTVCAGKTLTVQTDCLISTGNVSGVPTTNPPFTGTTTGGSGTAVTGGGTTPPDAVTNAFATFNATFTAVTSTPLVYTFVCYNSVGCSSTTVTSLTVSVVAQPQTATAVTGFAASTAVTTLCQSPNALTAVATCATSETAYVTVSGTGIGISGAVGRTTTATIAAGATGVFGYTVTCGNASCSATAYTKSLTIVEAAPVATFTTIAGSTTLTATNAATVCSGQTLTINTNCLTSTLVSGGGTTTNPPLNGTNTQGSSGTISNGGSTGGSSTTTLTYASYTGVFNESVTKTYVYTFVCTNSAGCSSTAVSSLSVTVNPTPGSASVAGISNTSVCQTSSAISITAVCTSGSAVVTGSAGLVAGTSSATTISTIPATVTGVVGYSVVCTNASGCSSAAQVYSLTINPAPNNASVTLVASGAGSATATSSATVCSGQTLTIQTNCLVSSVQNATSTQDNPPFTGIPGGGGVIGGGSTIGGGTTNTFASYSAVFTATTTQTYVYTVVCQDPQTGCRSVTPTAFTVVVNPIPGDVTVRNITSTSVCQSATVQSVTASCVAGTTAVVTVGSNWGVTPGNSSSVTIVNLPASTTGVFNYTAVCVNASGCQGPAKTFSQTVVAAPVNATVTASASGNTIPNVTGNTGPRPVLTICKGAPISLTIIGCTSISNNDGTTPVTGQISVTNTGAVGGIGGGGSSPTTSNTLAATIFTDQITVSGVYTVTLACSNGSCQSQTITSFSVNITDAPTASVTVSGFAAACTSGASVTGTLSCPTGSNVYYTLTGGSSLTSAPTGTASTVSLTTTGSAVYTLVANCGTTPTCLGPVTTRTFNGGIATPAPSSIQALPNAICAGTSSVLSTTATACPGGTVLWYSATTNTTVGSGISLTVTPTATTSYYASCSANGCESAFTTQVVVTVLPMPSGIPAIQALPNPVAAGASVTLTAFGCGTGSQVIFYTDAAGTVEAGRSLTGSLVVNPTANTTYYGACFNGTCRGMVSTGGTLVTVQACNFVANITPSSATLCPGGSVVLTSSGGSSYVWNNGAGNVQSITVQAPGVYNVIVTNASGCTALASATVVAGSSPVVAISGNTNIVQGQTAVLTASGGATYVWSTGATTPTISTQTGGVYSVTVTSLAGCSASGQTTVTVTPLPAAPSVTPGTNLQACLGQNVLLTAACATGTPRFNRGNASFNQATYSVESPVAGPVSLNVVCVVNGVEGTVTPVTVTFNTSPNVSIAGDGKICVTSGVVTGATLTASGAASYLWSNGATTPTITVTTPGVISVTGTTAGCSNIAQTTTFSAICGTGQALAITGASINCTTRQITINTTGGDGTAIDGRILLVTNFQPSAQPLILDAGVFAERKPVQLQVRQSGVMSAIFTFDYSAQCSGGGTVTPPPTSTTTATGNTITVCGQPYVLTGAPFAVGATFTCNPGTTPHVVNFIPAGGVVDANSVIEFMSIGITPWTQACSETLDLNNFDNNTFTINARQRNTQTGAILATAQIVVTSPCVRKDAAGREATTADALDVTVLGNPTLSDKVEVEVRGAEGQRLQLRMTDGQGASVSEISVEKANSVERQTLGLGRSAGMYFLQVITPSKVKTVKVIRQ